MFYICSFHSQLAWSWTKCRFHLFSLNSKNWTLSIESVLFTFSLILTTFFVLYFFLHDFFSQTFLMRSFSFFLKCILQKCTIAFAFFLVIFQEKNFMPVLWFFLSLLFRGDINIYLLRLLGLRESESWFCFSSSFL